jgi:hypothetical protein
MVTMTGQYNMNRRKSDQVTIRQNRPVIDLFVSMVFAAQDG